ncbi:glutamine--fructose-6-phosphate transaminase (isomerizing) [Facklamia miroungae]|uniref:Glutamine--fructose-6-phosphate aminotransferase [isomerizing] n=1 Tax=Facklamia miroungae TaxID=120956 RepID=A0A1G7QMA8_9LACT|nr:glutamine--fructose-6-phosphate transaminase (isomerizing) [Facklamia miroungae]NKZ28994.1 glutamine--fructose-6-phosphate transaminase (isomerizing) [Facklamia miroungae]SDF99687.1 glucosamine--fructose-6-phosphate aminotransferase (isomerizing) [Facklamia miroungae]
MCGIVGFIGEGNVPRVILDGLAKLEYRGYDSAGLYLLSQQGQGYLFKEKGRIADLEKAVNHTLDSGIGIGHTRWATHGSATRENAHPHQSNSGRYTLVHNGVIENYLDLKTTYLSQVDLKSETDTEIIVALIAHFSEQGLSTKEAFKKVLDLIEGSYAIGLIDQEDPELLYAAKKKSPLLVGVGEGFNVIVSDAMATIELTSKYIEIHDGELLMIRSDQVTIEDSTGKTVQRSAYIADLDASDLDKGTYPHYMLKEMDEQAAVVRKNILSYQSQAGEFEIEAELLAKIHQADRLYILACGTSYHAGLVGKVIIEELAKIPVEVHLSSEFAYHQPLLSQHPFFIFISQSGETADSRQALVKVNELNLPSLTITNVKGSTLSRESDFTLLLNAGPEIAVASTKAYTAQLTVLAILADVLAENHDFSMAHELSMVSQAIERVFAQKEELNSWVQMGLNEVSHAFYVGRYLDYLVAMEAALKLKEISYIHTEAFASGELKHGTIALIEEGTPVIALITDEVTALNTRSNLEEVKARGAKTFVIASDSLAKEGDFTLPQVHPLLTPIVSVVACQLLAYLATVARGLDVDKPRNLAKSVTVE